MPRPHAAPTCLGALAALLLAAAAAAAAEVTHLPAAEVAAAFARGAVLVDGEGRDYMVHASRRDAPGRPEVHTADTDIIYVLEGAATLVTGGALVDATATAPGELRGSAVRDGVARRLAAGDVVVVPQGVPHWFQAVERPVVYYVVKVR